MFGIFKKKDYDFKVIIDGMHCVNCSGKVEKALNEIDGVSATVDLKKKTAFVKASEDKKELIKNAVEELGFSVLEIK